METNKCSCGWHRYEFKDGKPWCDECNQEADLDVCRLFHPQLPGDQMKDKPTIEERIDALEAKVKELEDTKADRRDIIVVSGPPMRDGGWPSDPLPDFVRNPQC